MLRAALLFCCLFAAAAPAAQAAATVQFLAGGAGEVTIAGDAADDDVTLTQTGDAYVLSRGGGGLTAVAPCAGGPAAVTCPLAAGVAADLGGGNDKLTTFGLATPLQAAGGSGDDTLSGGAGDDVL